MEIDYDLQDQELRDEIDSEEALTLARILSEITGRPIRPADVLSRA